MRSVIFSIDTSDRNTSIVTVEIDGAIEERKVDAPLGSGSAVLTTIEALLDKHELKISDITQIRVMTGPGSYTGLRVGASIANTLSWLLKIGINNDPAGSIVSPQYS